MKHSIISILAIGLSSFALCSCVAKGTNVSTAVQPTADLAPQSVKGKTIVFNYDNAKERTDAGSDISPWESVDYKSKSISFPNGNKVENKVRSTDITSLISRTYTKKGRNIAIIDEDYPNQGVIYELKWNTPTNGTATQKTFCGTAMIEIKDITFIIK